MTDTDFEEVEFRHNKLYRNPRKGKICGVCAGISDFFGLDVTVVRIIAIVALFVVTGPMLIGYFLAAWLLPIKPRTIVQSKREDKFWRDVRVRPSETAKNLSFRFKEMDHRLSRIEAHVTSREARLRREFRNL